MEAVDAVLVHVHNGTMDFYVASALIERVMVASLYNSRILLHDPSSAKVLVKS